MQNAEFNPGRTGTSRFYSSFCILHSAFPATPHPCPLPEYRERRMHLVPPTVSRDAERSASSRTKNALRFASRLTGGERGTGTDRTRLGRTVRSRGVVWLSPRGLSPRCLSRHRVERAGGAGGQIGAGLLPQDA